MLIGIILLIVLFAFGFNLVMLLYLTGLMNVSLMCVCNLNSVAPSLVSKRLKNKDWWSYLGLITCDKMGLMWNSNNREVYFVVNFLPFVENVFLDNAKLKTFMLMTCVAAKWIGPTSSLSLRLG